MIKNRPLILVVNDDGIKSQGILILSSIMREIGEVFVVAPDVNRSGVSHAMTLNQDIYIENVDRDKRQFQINCQVGLVVTWGSLRATS